MLGPATFCQLPNPFRAYDWDTLARKPAISGMAWQRMRTYRAQGGSPNTRVYKCLFCALQQLVITIKANVLLAPNSPQEMSS